jgi:1,4-dihydroxy-2-naphthoyl-CoA synthase
MQNIAIRRLKANFPNFRFFARNFCSKNDKSVKTNNDLTSTDKVLFTQHTPYVLEVALNKPKQLNSLDLKMIKTLLKRVRQWVPETIESSDDESSASEKDKHKENEEEIPKVMIMTGTGNKAFCAGGDIVDIYKAYKERNDVKGAKDFFR